MAPRMNMSREAVVRFVERWNKRRDVSPHPTAGDIAHGLGFETVDRARTHIRYAEWAKWIERAEPQGRTLTYRVTDAGRAAIGTVLEPTVTAS